METLLTASYGSLEEFVKDLIRIEHLIEKWERNHPNYYANIVAEVDGGEFYTIKVLCKRL